MFGKCLKHEFRATSRTLVPFLIAILLIGLLLGIGLGVGLSLQENATLDPSVSIIGALLFTFLMLVMGGLMIAVEIVAFVLIIRRFYSAFFTDEGYLSFTLPVTANQHILSKFTVAAVWQVAVLLVMLLAYGFVLGGVLLSVAESDTLIREISALLAEMGTIFADAFGAGFLPLFVLTVIASVAASVFMLYFSIALACMLAKKYRVILGILCYYGINMVFSMVSGFFGMILMISTASSDSLSGYMSATMLVSLALVLIEAVLCYIGTKWIMEKKINLA